MKYTEIDFYFIENVLVNVSTVGCYRFQSIIKLASMRNMVFCDYSRRVLFALIKKNGDIISKIKK